MIVKELLEHLKTCNPNAEVLLRSYPNVLIYILWRKFRNRLLWRFQGARLMTVKELIKHLEECNTNAEVLLRSYPNDFDYSIMDLNLDEDTLNNWVVIEFEENENE